jgi:hypothetical protein
LIWWKSFNPGKSYHEKRDLLKTLLLNLKEKRVVALALYFDKCSIWVIFFRAIICDLTLFSKNQMNFNTDKRSSNPSGTLESQYSFPAF